MKQYKVNTVLVGLFTSIIILILAFLLIWQSNLFIRVSGYELIGRFDSVGGLLTQSEVRFRGYRVGRVIDIQPQKDAILVRFSVMNDVQIPHGSSLRVIFDGLVGEKYVDIIPDPNALEYLSPGEVLVGYSTAGIADFVDVGTKNLAEIQEVLRAFRKISTNPDVMNSIQNSIFAVEAITENTNAVLEQIRQFSEDDNIQQIVNNLNTISFELSKTIDADFAKNLSLTIENFQQASESLNDLLSREGFKTDVRSAVVEGKKMFRTVDSVFDTFSKITIDSNTSVYKANEEKGNWLSANVDFGYKSSFLRLGVGNRLTTDVMVNLQQSLALFDSLRARFGSFYSFPGVGFDYTLYNLHLKTDIYNFDSAQLDAFLYYPIINKFYVSIGATDLLDNDQNKSYLFGFKLATN